jgi:uncharacterized membrane protein
MIAGLLRAAAAGLLLAGVIHVVAVLTIPDLAPDDAVDRVLRVARPEVMSPLPADGSVIADLDPYFVHAACVFDAAEGPTEVAGTMPGDVWTLVAVAGSATVFGSLEPGGVTGNRLDLVVGTAADVERIRLARAEEGRPVTTIETDPREGFVLVRAFAGPRREEASARAEALAALACRPLR